MATAVAFTLSEASSILNPPMTETQLRTIITALRWQPEGWRQTGRVGHPYPTYPAEEILRLHAALLPWLTGYDLVK
jgi:hypothetical protein